MDPDVILPRVKDLLDDKTYSNLNRILRFGCPAHYNVHGMRENFKKYREYKNHSSLAENEARAKSALNKEDKREFVLTFPDWMTDLIPDLHVNLQALVMIPGKKDCLVFDLSFMVDENSHLYNADCDSELEPDIFFRCAWVHHLTYIHNLCISFPNEEIFITDDDITSAFQQIKYNSNVISAKAFIIGPWLFVYTGQNFGDQPSPANFEPIAKAQTALAS